MPEKKRKKKRKLQFDDLAADAAFFDLRTKGKKDENKNA